MIAISDDKLLVRLGRPDRALKKVLGRRVDSLDVSNRVKHTLAAANILTVFDVITHLESDLLRVPNFGRKSLAEIKRVLGQWSLEVGMCESVYDAANHRWLIPTLTDDWPATPLRRKGFK